MSALAVEKPTDCLVDVKRERLPSPEAMDTNNNNNYGDLGSESSSEESARRSTAAAASRAGGLGMRNSSAAAGGRQMNGIAKQEIGGGGSQMQQSSGQIGTTSSSSSGRLSSSDLNGRRKSADLLRGLISPEFPSQTGTPTSLSQLIPSLGSAFLENSEFATPMGSGRLSPQVADRLNRKRALSISPLSASSSLDLNSLIRTSPTSLVNYINGSRTSSAGSFGHLSPSMFSNIHHQPQHGRPMQVSLRNNAYPATSGHSTGGANTFSGQHHGDFIEEETTIQVKKEMDANSPPTNSNQHCSANLSPPMQQGDLLKMEDIGDHIFDSASNSQNGGVNIKMEPGLHDATNPYIPPPLIPLGLETVQEEPGNMLGSEEDDLMHSDPMDYTAMMSGSNDCEFETKLGIIHDPGIQKRIYYSYPSVEEPHHNQCRWAGCQTQCEDLDSLVAHVNTDHIYRDSKKEFVCHWQGCVRERKPFKAQYMLLVHMRRHTGEKPHKCTVS